MVRSSILGRLILQILFWEESFLRGCFVHMQSGPGCLAYILAVAVKRSFIILRIVELQM